MKDRYGSLLDWRVQWLDGTVEPGVHVTHAAYICGNFRKLFISVIFPLPLSNHSHFSLHFFKIVVKTILCLNIGVSNDPIRDT